MYRCFTTIDARDIASFYFSVYKRIKPCYNLDNTARFLLTELNFDSSSVRTAIRIAYNDTYVLRLKNIDETIRNGLSARLLTVRVIRILNKRRKIERKCTHESARGTCLVKVTTSYVLRPPWVDWGRRRLGVPRLAELVRARPKSTYENRSFQASCRSDGLGLSCSGN